MKIDSTLRKRMCLVIFAFLGVAACNFAQSLPRELQDEQVLHWDRVLKAYDTYVDYPSPDNAKALLAALPADSINKESGDGNAALKHMFSSDNYPILLEEAWCADRVAIEILFRLLNICDGLYTENVETTLGWVVRDQPLLFLEMLLAYKDTYHVRMAQEYPVSFIGIGHNLHPKAAIYILEKRIEALETVKDPKYAEIKEACIKQLRRAIDVEREIL